MRTKVIAALLAVLTALGGLNLFQSIKNKLTHNDQVHTEAVVLAEDEGITVREEGNRIVIRTSGVAVSHAEADVDVDVDTDFDFDFEFAFDADEASNDEEVMISERFDVKEGSTLMIDISHADVEIITGNSNEAHVEVTLHSNRMNRARERFEDMNWEVTQEDGDIIVTADDPSGWNNWNFSVDVRVHIPTQFNIDMETSHGDVDLGNLEGEIAVKTSHGDVEMGDVTSSRIWVKSSHGDIEGRTLNAGIIDLQTSHSDIEFDAIESKEFSATTSHADVEIGELWGETRIRTSHGDVQVMLADAEGADIETVHGDVEIRMVEGASMDVDLRGGEVTVGRNVDLVGRVSEDEVDGEINGGGAMLRVRTSHGEIVVR